MSRSGARGSDGWPPWSAPLAALAGLALVVLAAPVVRGVASLLGARIAAGHIPGGIETALAALREACWALVVIWIASRFRRALSVAGGERRQAGWSESVVLIAGLLMILYAFSVVWLASFPGRHVQSEVGPTVARASALLFVLQALIGIVQAPICEELMFRGYIFTALCNWRGVWPAALIAGLGWGALHLPVTPAVLCVPLGLFGVGLCLLYWRTGSLWPCVVAHSLNNAAAFASVEHLGTWQKPAIIAAGLITVLAAIFALTRPRPIQSTRDLWTISPSQSHRTIGRQLALRPTRPVGQASAP